MRQPGTEGKELHTKTSLSGNFPLIARPCESNSRFYFVHAKDKILDKSDQTKTTHSCLYPPTCLISTAAFLYIHASRNLYYSSHTLLSLHEILFNSLRGIGIKLFIHSF